MNLHMIRAIRLVNAQQQGLPSADFIAALDDINVGNALQELLRRRAVGARNALDAVTSGLDAADAATFLASGGLFSPYVAASSIAMEKIAASSTAMVGVASSSIAMARVLESATAYAAIAAVPAAMAALKSSTALPVASVPLMTSNTAPSGMASASTVLGDENPAWRGFDGNAATAWASSVENAGINEWLQYKFDAPVFIHSVFIHPYATPYNPIKCRIECSDNGVDYSVVKSFSPATDDQINMTLDQSYGFNKYWRLFIEKTYSTYQPGIHRLNFTGFVKPA